MPKGTVVLEQALVKAIEQEKTLLSPRYSLASAQDTFQVLQHYVSNSNKNDVVFFFGKQTRDWRITYLIPYCKQRDEVGFILTNLFAALHRLRIDGSDSRIAAMYHEEATKVFCRLKERTTLQVQKILACAMLFMQYDMNANLSHNVPVHLTVAAQLMTCINEPKDPNTTDDRLTACMKRIHHVYDLANALMLGSKLYTDILHYERECQLDASQMTKTMTPSIIDVDSLWSLVHLLWARFVVSTQTAMTIDAKTVTFLEQNLQILSNLFTRDSRYKSQVYSCVARCPFGPAIVYRLPAIRLLHAEINALILTLCSFNLGSLEYFDVTAARDSIFQSHAMQINSADAHYKHRVDEQFLHQCFPAIIPLMIAASELPDSNVAGQRWVSQFTQRFKVHGFGLGVLLVGIMKMIAPIGNDQQWGYVGAKKFILATREARRSGLA